ncbi:hypothetical protein [Methylocystis sp. S23]
MTLLFKALAFPDKRNAEAYFDLFEEALAKLPERHVRFALTAFRVGDLGDGKFVPKAAEVRQEVQRRMEAERVSAARKRAEDEMLARRREVENRKPPSAAEKARVQALVDGFKREMAARSVGG